MKRIVENRPITTHKGRDIVDTNHSIERLFDGRGVDSYTYPTVADFKKEVVSVIQSAIDKILSVYSDYSEEYLIHSRSTGIGVVIDWRPHKDQKYDDGNNHAIIISVLPVKNKHFAKNPSDVLLMVEESIPKSRLQEAAQENTMDRYVLEDLGIKVTLWEGKVWDIDSIILIVD